VVVAELDGLLARGARGAGAARALADTVPVVPAPGRGDAAIVAVAARLGATVVTADRALGAELRRRGVRVLRPRDRHRLEETEGLPPRRRGKG